MPILNGILTAAPLLRESNKPLSHEKKKPSVFNQKTIATPSRTQKNIAVEKIKNVAIRYAMSFIPEYFLIFYYPLHQADSEFQIRLTLKLQLRLRYRLLTLLHLTQSASAYQQ